MAWCVYVYVYVYALFSYHSQLKISCYGPCIICKSGRESSSFSAHQAKPTSKAAVTAPLSEIDNGVALPVQACAWPHQKKNLVLAAVMGGSFSGRKEISNFCTAEMGLSDVSCLLYKWRFAISGYFTLLYSMWLPISFVASIEPQSSSRKLCCSS